MENNNYKLYSTGTRLETFTTIKFKSCSSGLRLMIARCHNPEDRDMNYRPIGMEH